MCMCVYVRACVCLYVLITITVTRMVRGTDFEGGLGARRREPKSVRLMSGVSRYIFVGL